MHVDLSCKNIDWIVIKAKTGVVYCGQVGGMSCLHPEIEGYVIPIQINFSEELSEKTCEIACWGGSLSEKNIEELNKYFPIKIDDNINILLDVERLPEGTECWLPIRVENTNDIGFLCLSHNCD
jgi:hypothetical protein